MEENKSATIVLPENNFLSGVPMASESGVNTPNDTQLNVSDVKSRKKKWWILVIVLVIAIATGVVVIVLINSDSVDEESVESEPEKSQMATGSDVDSVDVDTKDNEDLEDVEDGDEPSMPIISPDTVTNERKYLEPEGWDIKFAYPDGVTEIEYSMQGDNYDGVLYIGSITKNKKVYNVDICGGKDGYVHYPFFLGVVERWVPAIQHESWESSPVEYGNVMLVEVDGVEYYADLDSPGNGCELGEDTAGYLEALEIVRELYRGVTIK